MKKITHIIVLLFTFALIPLVGLAQITAPTPEPVPVVGPIPELQGGPFDNGPVPANDFADIAAKQGLPIRSIGVLKAYAMEQVTNGRLSIYGDSILAVNGNVSVTAVGSGALDVLERLGQQAFSFELSNLKDRVYLGADLNNKDGFQLFGAWRNVGLRAYPEGIWINEKENFLNVTLVGNVPINVLGIHSARVITRNDAGQVIYQNALNVFNGHLFFPTNLVERTGEIIATFRESDGRLQTRVFGLEGGVRPTWRASGQVSLGLEGFYDFGTNPESVELHGVDIRGAVVRFSVKTGNSGEVRVIAIGGESNSGQKPIGFVYRLRGLSGTEDWSPWWSFEGISGGLYQPSFGGNVQYELIYILDPADLEGVPIFPNDGGKG